MSKQAAAPQQTIKKFQTAYDLSVDPGIDFTTAGPDGTRLPGVSLAHQSMQADCDVNLIVPEELARRVAEGQSAGLYADFTNVPDYHTAMGIVAQANEQFSALPAEVRKRFQNDPSEFLQFATDPDNGPELVKLGLATARPIPEETPPKNKPSGSSDPAVPAAGKGPNA